MPAPELFALPATWRSGPRAGRTRTRLYAMPGYAPHSLEASMPVVWLSASCVARGVSLKTRSPGRGQDPIGTRPRAAGHARTRRSRGRGSPTRAPAPEPQRPVVRPARLAFAASRLRSLLPARGCDAAMPYSGKSTLALVRGPCAGPARTAAVRHLRPASALPARWRFDATLTSLQPLSHCRCVASPR